MALLQQRLLAECCRRVKVYNPALFPAVSVIQVFNFKCASRQLYSEAEVLAHTTPGWLATLVGKDSLVEQCWGRGRVAFS